MVTLYSGTPGSGKSYRVADKIAYSSLVGNYNIICNFPVDLERFSVRAIFDPMLKFEWSRKWFEKLPYGLTHRKVKKQPMYLDNSRITVPFLKQYAIEHHTAGREGQTCVFIDEAGIKFNCRDFGKGDRQEWLDFFATHRHYGYNFVLISQHDRQLDRQIRYCIENEEKHYKLANFNWLGQLLAWLAGGQLFVVHRNWYGFRGEKQGVEVCRYRKKVASIYDTHYKF